MTTVQPDPGPWTAVADRPTPFSAAGSHFRVFVEGLQRKDGTWAGRVVFTDGQKMLRTGQETSQPNRAALEYWATGLESIYLEGAFKRAASGAGQA